MMAHTFREGWQQSSVLVKSGLIAAALVVLLALAIGGKSWFQNRAYEKREAARVAERQAWEAEREGYQHELDNLKGKLAEQEASNEALKVVAESKRKDRDEAVKEIENIEQQHEAAKQTVTDNSIGDAELRAAICKSLCTKGYKLSCCPK